MEQETRAQYNAGGRWAGTLPLLHPGLDYTLAFSLLETSDLELLLLVVLAPIIDE
jgi:hypothetical protein